MNKYENGKIYRLVCNNTGLNYYGSTVQALYQRKSGHKVDYKKGSGISSSKIIEGGNFDIILVEEFKCENKQQLEARERYYIENNECVNKNIPNRTKKEYNEANKEATVKNKKEYYEANKEVILKQIKENYEANKEAILKKKKEYREANKEKFKTKDTEYYKTNKEAILKQKKDYYQRTKQI
jgi:hypothetical protein